MFGVPRLIVGRHPYGAFSRNRTLVFANAAPDAGPGIHTGLLKPYLNINPGCRTAAVGQRDSPGDAQAPFPGADDRGRGR